MEGLKLTDQQHNIYLLTLKEMGLVQLKGYGQENGRVYLEFTPKGKALELLQKMEQEQSVPIQPKKLLDSFFAYKNIIRKVKEGVIG